MRAKVKGGKRTVAQQRSSRARSSQSKGRDWQKAVAKILALVTGTSKDDFFSNQGGDKGDIDVHMSAAAREAFPFWIECKNQKTLKIPEWIRKLDEDREAAGCDEPGLIITKLYGTSRALVTIELPDFLDAIYGPLSPEQREEITEMIRNKPKKGPTACPKTKTQK